MTTNDIVAVDSVRDFFDAAVQQAMQRHNVAPQRAITGYLVEILCQYVNRRLEVAQLVSNLVTAANQRTDERIDRLKQVGDQSLYVAGYFRASIGRRQLDLDYFDTVGGQAYRRLSYLLRRRGISSTLPAIYAELADEFRQFCLVLADVSDQSGPAATSSDADELVALYQHWLERGDEETAARLRAAGVLLRRTPGESN